MRTNRFMLRAAVPALVALSGLALSGCGAFNKSSNTDKYEANDPTRVAERIQANVVATTLFTDTAPADKATFTAILYDEDGRQFFGPDLTFEGEKILGQSTDAQSGARYVKADVPYTAGKTYTMAVQGHTTSTPPAPAPMRVTSPERSVVPDPNDATKQITLDLFVQPATQGATISWSGGDPNLPVYIVILGDPTTQSATNVRRLYVSDDPSQSPTDPNNYGKPIPNTGSFTIPAQLTERVVATNGTVSTRTVNTFDNPNTKAPTQYRVFWVYVIQRSATINQPVTFAAESIATARLGVLPKIP